MSESIPEPNPDEAPEPPVAVDPTPVVTLLDARRAELMGGEDSIGVRCQRVEELQEQLAEQQAALAACEAELAALDAAIALIAPPVPTGPDTELEV